MTLEEKDKYIADNLMKLEPDTLRYMVADLTAEVERLTAERDRYKAKCEEQRNMLEDVVNELDLSDGMIEQHGPLGTAPAVLVRLILGSKDREIAMLKAGMKPLAEAVQGGYAG